MEAKIIHRPLISPDLQHLDKSVWKEDSSISLVIASTTISVSLFLPLQLLDHSISLQKLQRATKSRRFPI